MGLSASISSARCFNRSAKKLARVASASCLKVRTGLIHGVVLGRPRHVGALTILAVLCRDEPPQWSHHCHQVCAYRASYPQPSFRPVYDVVPDPPYRSPARAMHHNYETNIVRTEYSKGALVSHRRITTGQKAFIMYSALTSLGPISRTCLISCVSCLHGFFHDSRVLLMLCHISSQCGRKFNVKTVAMLAKQMVSFSASRLLVLLLNSRDRSSGYNVYTKRISSIGKLFSFKLDIELTCHVRCRLAISNPVRVNVPYPDCLN